MYFARRDGKPNRRTPNTGNESSSRKCTRKAPRCIRRGRWSGRGNADHIVPCHVTGAGRRSGRVGSCTRARITKRACLRGAVENRIREVRHAAPSGEGPRTTRQNVTRARRQYVRIYVRVYVRLVGCDDVIIWRGKRVPMIKVGRRRRRRRQLWLRNRRSRIRDEIP